MTYVRNMLTQPWHIRFSPYGPWSLCGIQPYKGQWAYEAPEDADFPEGDRLCQNCDREQVKE